MADRVHPHGSPESPSSPTEKASDQLQPEAKPDPPSPARTYVVKVPKDQILRVPPPQNAKLFERYTRRSSQRGRRCCCITLLSLMVLVFLAAAAVGIFYLVVKPKSPSYTVTGLSISGLNLTSSSSTPVSSEIVVAVQAKNPNDKVGIYHVGGSSAHAYYTDVSLGDGVLPVLYLPSNSERAFNVTLRGDGIVLGTEVRESLTSGQNQGSVPLRLKVRAPVKFKVGAVKTWKITVKLTCDVTVDKLTAGAKIVREDCHYGVKIF